MTTKKTPAKRTTKKPNDFLARLQNLPAPTPRAKKSPTKTKAEAVNAALFAFYKSVNKAQAVLEAALKA